MRLRLLRSLITYVILILYLLMPMLDRMVCTYCIGNAPFQCGITIGHLQAPYDDVIYFSKNVTQSESSGAQAAKSFCSICANFLMGVEVFYPDVHIPVAKCDVSCTGSTLRELHSSINKPPQNLLV